MPELTSPRDQQTGATTLLFLLTPRGLVCHPFLKVLELLLQPGHYVLAYKQVSVVQIINNELLVSWSCCVQAGNILPSWYVTDGPHNSLRKTCTAGKGRLADSRRHN